MVQVDREVALLAGEINNARKKKVRGRGMADSVILATARRASAKVVTGDRHFEGFAGAVLI